MADQPSKGLRLERSLLSSSATRRLPAVLCHESDIGIEQATTSLLKKTYNKTIHLLDMKETQVEVEPRSSQFNQESLDQETFSKEIIDQHSIDQGDLDQESFDQESFDQENIGHNSIDQDSIDQERIGQDSVDQDSIDQENVERETLAKQRRYAGIGLLLYSLPLNNIKSNLSSPGIRGSSYRLTVLVHVVMHAMLRTC
ncbi:MAG: hypothetical protein LQ344_007588 [Seirophora lacunosa]|nr:MAG: hypothetical protein LQ344_007588 [Seirophora lacunosa]